ncbi:MAG: hypothetical protein SFT94_01950 [Pseudanabaenaceae cyanobacterium bins.68]|nr:hypothetical protein [Pseudanabaenaceae cyanobacterium bins.68]
MPKSATHKKKLKYRAAKYGKRRLDQLKRNIWLWQRLIILLLIEILRRSLRALVIGLLKLLKWFEQLQVNLQSQPKIHTQIKPKIKLSWRKPRLPSVAGLSVLSIFGLAGLSYYGITQPSINTLNCRGKINGRWQTNLGEIQLQESSTGIKANFSYYNIRRGRVSSKINGRLDYDVLNFDWQEQAEQQPVKSEGQGILLFRQQCQEFYGSYSSISLKNGSFQGILIQAIALN